MSSENVFQYEHISFVLSMLWSYGLSPIDPRVHGTAPYCGVPAGKICQESMVKAPLAPSIIVSEAARGQYKTR